jgi:tetratricopeptide (TPR) repeat protein
MSMPGVGRDLARLAMSDPFGILSCFMMRRINLLEFAGEADPLTSDTNRLALEWPKRTLETDRTDVLVGLGSAGENPVGLLTGMDTDSPEYKILRDRLDRCRTAHDFFVRSLVAIRDGRIREAVSLLAESPTMCPLNGVFVHTLADYYMVLSRSLLGSGRVEEAIGVARRSVELLPESPRAYHNLASLESTRDPATAVALLERAIQLNPYYVPAYLLKAETELSSGKPKDAAETVGRVLPMEPFNTQAHHLRALSFIRRQMYQEARAELEIVLEADPGNLAATEALAYSYLVEEDLDRAERLYRRILESKPDHLGALNNYATILAERRQYREAVRVWTRALELNPGNKNIIDNIEDARRNMRR